MFCCRSITTLSQCPLVLVACIVLGISGCSSPMPWGTERLTVATFNVEWLGDGVADKVTRTDGEYMRIADIIIKTGADVVGLQEIESQAALNKVLRFLKDEHEYQGVVLEGSGQQNTAVIWKTGVEVKPVGAYRALESSAGRSRPGYVVECRKGAFDWMMMVVHFKSTSRYDSTTALRELAKNIRIAQADAVVRWADSVIAVKDKDVVILGDFNDFPERKTNATLSAIVDSPTLHFVTAGLTSCKDAKWKTIDHVVVSSSVKERLIPGTLRAENFYGYLEKSDAEKVSDHCPIIVSFDARTR